MISLTPALPARFAYSGTWPFEHLTGTSPFLDLSNGSEVRSGRLPVARCAAASSAVLAASALSRVASLTAAELGAEVAVWMGREGFGEAQQVVQRLLQGSEAWQEVVEQGVRGLMDGGFSDGTGIAMAVASGAREVVVVLNSYSSNEAGPCLRSLGGLLARKARRNVREPLKNNEKQVKKTLIIMKNAQNLMKKP